MDKHLEVAEKYLFNEGFPHEVANDIKTGLALRAQAKSKLQPGQRLIANTIDHFKNMWDAQLEEEITKVLHGKSGLSSGDRKFIIEQAARTVYRLQQEEIYKSNVSDGAKFIEDADESWTKLSDSQVIKITNGAGGQMPTEKDTVVVDYEGSLLNGHVFDNANGAKFELGKVVKGFREAILRMSVGDSCETVFTSDLGYGDRKAGPIPQGSALKFKITLKDIA